MQDQLNHFNNNSGYNGGNGNVPGGSISTMYIY